MKPLYQALTAGIGVALLHALILSRGWTFWDVSIVSISSLSAGIFFVLSMIFTSTVQDYKQANIHIATLRGKLLWLNDMNMVGSEAEPAYDPSPLRSALLRATEHLRGYIENGTTLKEANDAVTDILCASRALRTMLPSSQCTILNQHHDIRQSLSYLAYLKHHNFPAVGYVFLAFFVIFVIALQLFSATQNAMLDILFIFSLTAILVFFIAFIHDLDHPFRTELACFTLDTRPLKYTEAVLEKQTYSASTAIVTYENTDVLRV